MKSMYYTYCTYYIYIAHSTFTIISYDIIFTAQASPLRCIKWKRKKEKQKVKEEKNRGKKGRKNSENRSEFNCLFVPSTFYQFLNVRIVL